MMKDFGAAFAKAVLARQAAERARLPEQLRALDFWQTDGVAAAAAFEIERLQDEVATLRAALGLAVEAPHA